MSEPDAHTPRPLTIAASVACVTGLAVTVPVLEVLGGHPEFFVARAAPRTDAVLVGIALGVATPLVFAGVVGLVAYAHRTLGMIVHGVVFSSLCALVTFQLARQTVGEDAPVVVASVLLGLAFTVGLWRSRAAWPILRLGAAVPVLALGLFVLVWPASRVAMGSGDVEAIESHVAPGTPVTVVVFDELPTASLLSGPDEIDAARFPNFAALAEDGVWYRNAITVSDRTTLAVPSVFTGRRVDDDALPIAADHPVSLFTLLGRTHDIHTVQPVTDLCPVSVCEGLVRRGGAPTGVASLGSDVALITAHVLLPTRVSDRLPRIDRAWGRFGRAPERHHAEDGSASPSEGPTAFPVVELMNEAVEADRRRDFLGVVQERGSDPHAYLLHSLLPHVPYRLLPTGQAVLPSPLSGTGDDEVWDDRWLGRHAQAQHLLQLGFVDRLLGDLLDDLDRAGHYDDGIVVVTADHGVSFREGTERRRITEANVPDVAAVPLLVKYPDGPAGEVDHRPAETVDIVPTVLDVLGVHPPEDLDGTSLLDDPPDVETRTVDGLVADPTFTVEQADPWQIARGIRRVFGEGWGDVYRHDPRSHLIGASVDDLVVASATGWEATVDRLGEILAAAPDDDPLPGVVWGELQYDSTPSRDVPLAIAFDDRIVAIGRSYDHGDRAGRFVSLVPPDAYTGGVDAVSIYTVEDRSDGTVLRPVRNASAG